MVLGHELGGLFGVLVGGEGGGGEKEKRFSGVVRWRVGRREVGDLPTTSRASPARAGPGRRLPLSTKRATGGPALGFSGTRF